MLDLEYPEGVLVEDTTNGLRAGHRAFKAKMGGGSWLKGRAAGDRRDLRAIRMVHKALTGCGQVPADANNYYNLDESIRLLGDAADIKLYWAEEMFSEDAAHHEDYRRLRAYIEEKGLPTLLADGEGGHGGADLLMLLEGGLIQVSQPDIRTLGISGFPDYAREIEPLGASIAPHSWAEHLGVLEARLLGMVVRNFAMVEDCRLESKVLKFPNVRVRDGKMTIASAPGLGIFTDEVAYKEKCAPYAETSEAG